MKAMNAAGLKETMYEAITQGDKDFSALVSKMKQANIDVIYFGGYQTEGGLIVRQMRDQMEKLRAQLRDTMTKLRDAEERVYRLEGRDQDERRGRRFGRREFGRGADDPRRAPGDDRRPRTRPEAPGSHPETPRERPGSSSADVEKKLDQIMKEIEEIKRELRNRK